MIKDKIFLYSLLFILILFPLGQLSRISLPWPEVRLYGHDLAIGFLTGFYLVLLSKKEVNPQRGYLFRPILLFFLVSLFSLLISLPRFTFNENLIASLYLFRWLGYTFIYFALLELNKRDTKRVFEYLVLAGVVAAVFGLIQYLIYPDAWPLTADLWDPHLSRVIGTYLDPGYTGLIYVFTLVLLFLNPWPNRLKLALLTVVYFAFSFTYSRSAYLAFLAAFALLSWLKKSPRYFLISAALLGLTVILLPRPHGEGTRLERQSTVSSRLVNWQQAIEIIKRYPIAGVGFNHYRYEQRNQGFLGKDWLLTHAGAGADSSLLFVLATGGVFGLFAYLFLWLKIFKHQAAIVLLTAGGLFIHSFFNNSLFYAWIMIWFWMILGIFERKGNQGV